MYSIVIHVPFRRRDQRRCEVASDWAKSIELLRDSFRGRFGPVQIVAPELPAGEGPIGSQSPRTLDAEDDGVMFRSLGPAGLRTRAFWTNYPRIRAACESAARDSQVVHAGVGNIYQPYPLLGFRAARGRATTVFVMDTDAVAQIRDMAKGSPLTKRLGAGAVASVYERAARSSVREASLCLLKGRLLMDRYASDARDARSFYDTSFAAADIIDATRLDEKCGEAMRGGEVRAVTVGRLIDRKCVDHTIRAIHRARQRGAMISLDLIGDGPERAALETLSHELGLGGVVRFVGSMAYGPGLMRTLAGYHVQVFSPTAEDTPRALFDGLASGCALAAYGVPFVREIADSCGHGEVAAVGDEAALAAAMVRLCEDRGGLVNRMRAAVAAAPAQTAESWYRRRAEWTIEAYERDQREHRTARV